MDHEDLAEVNPELTVRVGILDELQEAAGVAPAQLGPQEEAHPNHRTHESLAWMLRPMTTT